MSARSYTATEVSRHNSPNDLWIVLHGKVYDVTKFLKEHPGGEDVLINLAGQDGTECFDDIGHSQEAQLLKDGYEIGKLEGTTTADAGASTRPAPAATTTTTTTTTTTKTSKKEPSKHDDDDEWTYEEHRGDSSPFFPILIAAGVVVYGALFYHFFY